METTMLGFVFNCLLNVSTRALYWLLGTLTSTGLDFGTNALLPEYPMSATIRSPSVSIDFRVRLKILKILTVPHSKALCALTNVPFVKEIPTLCRSLGPWKLWEYQRGLKRLGSIIRKLRTVHTFEFTKTRYIWQTVFPSIPQKRWKLEYKKSGLIKKSR